MIRRVALMSVVCAVGGLAVPMVADAHDPIIIDDAQTTPESGPLLLDGTISFALYGVADGPGDTRGFRVRLAEGTRFSVSLLVPDLPPEQSLSPDQLPNLRIESPDGTVRTLAPDIRVAFDEPFTGTRYLRLLDLDEPALAGDYAVTVVGAAPARFTVSVGVIEQFGTAAENVIDRESGVAGVLEWYATPPPEAAPMSTVPVTTAPVTTVPVTTAPPDGDPPVDSAGEEPGATKSTSSFREVIRPGVGRLVILAALVAVVVVLVRRRRSGGA